MNWIETGSSEPQSLSEARLQLHYGALVLASAAHSLIEHQSDDSHTNLGLDLQGEFLSTRSFAVAKSLKLRLSVPTLSLQMVEGSETRAEYSLPSHSVNEALAWVQSQVLAISGEDRQVSLRGYDDFPESPLREGGRFPSADQVALTVLGHWFANGQALIETLRADHPKLSELRVWPHHLDLGGLLPLEDGGDKMLGLGLSPGDGNYDQPYLYVSPYPQPDSTEDLGPLQVGSWHSKGFVSAVATADQILGTGAPKDAAETYLKEAVAAGLRLVS